MKASEAQQQAAYTAYYAAVNDWSIEQKGRVYTIAKREPMFDSASREKVTTVWQFDDKVTADRFLITKILEEIANAVVSTK